MDTHNLVLIELDAIVEEFMPSPMPPDIGDATKLSDLRLDSVAFSSLVTRLEMKFGFIPLGILRGTSFPETIGELIEAYEQV